MDPAPRPAHPDGGRLHVHVGPALPGDALGADGRLDAAHQVGAAARRRRLRVPGVHAARALLLRHATCRRSVLTLLIPLYMCSIIITMSLRLCGDVYTTI